MGSEREKEKKEGDGSLQRVPLSCFKLPLFSLSVPCMCLPTLPPPSLHQDCAETEVDRNKCCTLCNMFFTSAIVAQSHYQGKTHAKRVRLVLGEPPNLSAVASLTSAGLTSPHSAATGKIVILTDLRTNNNDGTFHSHLYLLHSASLEEKAIFSSKHIFLSNIELETFFGVFSRVAKRQEAKITVR